MKIENGANVAVVVNRTWANMHGVKMFLRPNESSQTDIRGVDESHILFARVVDAEGSIGVWIEVHNQGEDATTDRVRMLIPWKEVLTIIVAAQFSPEIRHEARRIGFSGQTEAE